MAGITWVWLGRVPYGEALQRQRTYREGILDHRNPSVLWMLEHDPVVTVGRRGDQGTPDADFFRERGIEFHRTERGGLATYHGPGQLVGYLLCDIEAHGLTVRRTVEGLEQGLIGWLAERGVEAGLREGAPGVWVGNDKIAALGLHFRKGVSMHGFALNLQVDLAPYDLFVPCGIADAGVTSLHRQPGVRAPAPREAAASVAATVLDALGLDALGPDPAPGPRGRG